MSKFAPHRRSQNNPRATPSTVCQKCLGTGHFIYECKSVRPYVSRPSRTQQLENPGVLAKLKSEGKPSVEVPEEFKNKSGTANRILEAKEKERNLEKEREKDKAKGKEPARKRAKRSSSSPSRSSSDSDSSSSNSDSDSSGSSDSDSSHSRHRNRKRRVVRRSRSKSSSDDSVDQSRGRSQRSG